MKTKLLILLLFIGLGASAQTYTNVYNYGYNWLRGKFQNTLIIPHGTTPVFNSVGDSAGAIFYNTTDSAFYIHTGTSWMQLSTGGSTYLAGWGLSLNTSTFSVDTGANKIPTKWYVDNRFYTKTQINSFFSGATPISGYNKTFWDNSYASWAAAQALGGWALQQALVDSAAAIRGSITTGSVTQAQLDDTASAIRGDFPTGGIWGSITGTLSDQTDLQTALNAKQAALSGIGIVKSTGGTISYLTDNSTNWNTAYDDRLKWDGGATGLVAATGRTSLGGTTVGQNLFTAANPGALRYPRINADNTVTFRSYAEVLGDIGAQASLGFTPEDVANKATDFSVVNNTKYPTTQAVNNLVNSVNQKFGDGDALATGHRYFDFNGFQYYLDRIGKSEMYFANGSNWVWDDNYSYFQVINPSGAPVYHDHIGNSDDVYHQIGARNKADLFLGSKTGGTQGGYFHLDIVEGANNQNFYIDSAGVLFSPHLGQFRIDSLNAASTGDTSLVMWNKTTGKVTYKNISDFATTGDLSGYVPTSRTLTINGTTYDLSANRSWSLGLQEVTDVNAITTNNLTTGLINWRYSGTTVGNLTAVVSGSNYGGSLRLKDYSTSFFTQLYPQNGLAAGNQIFLPNTGNVVDTVFTFHDWRALGGGGGSGTVSSGTAQQVPYYTGTGTTVGPMDGVEWWNTNRQLYISGSGSESPNIHFFDGVNDVLRVGWNNTNGAAELNASGWPLEIEGSTIKLTGPTTDNTATNVYAEDASGNLVLRTVASLGASVSDGDKGDIVVSGSGAVWDIDAGVIVNADINASAAIDATKLIDGSITNTELGYINTLTSNAQTQIDGKQATLVSGTNIKTINGSSILGSGDLSVSASAGGSSGQMQYNNAGALAGFGSWDGSQMIISSTTARMLKLDATSGDSYMQFNTTGNTITTGAESSSGGLRYFIFDDDAGIYRFKINSLGENIFEHTGQQSLVRFKGSAREVGFGLDGSSLFSTYDYTNARYLTAFTSDGKAIFGGTTTSTSAGMVQVDGAMSMTEQAEPATPSTGHVIYWFGTDGILRGKDDAGTVTNYGSGAGEANTASNLGGGLANWDSKSGVDLRFNTFATADFDLASNLITIDATKWVSNSQANTYTAGMKQTFAGNATNAAINLAGLTANPSSLTAGDLWFRSDLGKMTFYDGASSQSIVTEASAQTVTSKTFNLTNNTLTGTKAQFDIALSDADFATLAGTETLTNKRITKRTGTATSSATPTINTDNVDFYSLTAQAVDITSFTTNLSGTPTEGQLLWIAVTGTASRALSFGASFEASTVALPTTTSGTSRLDMGFVWNSVTSKWRIVAVQ
jgi:hypothetical protein